MMSDKDIEEKEFKEKELEASEPRYKFDEENHVHLLDGKPLIGTSGVTGVLSKPLTWWASGLACEKFGWINKGNATKGWVKKEDRLNSAWKKWEEIVKLDAEQYLSLLDEAYSAHSKKLDSTAKSGTDLHAELERYVKNKMSNRMAVYEEKIMPFILWAEENVEEFIWSEVNCFSEKLWLGGISDVGAKLKDGKTVIIDFKSSKEAYESQFIQCAGYDIQITENGGYTKDGVKVLTLKDKIDGYIIVPFGAEKVEPVFRWNTDELKEAFEACLKLQKLLNK